jgi:hypothetical protein
MGPEIFHKNLHSIKEGNKRDCVVGIFLDINVKSKRLVALTKVNVQIP